jgi:transposase-like protein
MKKRREQAWTKWRKLVSEQSKSGQSVAVFCRQRKLCDPQFYVWRKRLQESEDEKFVEVGVKALADTNAGRRPGAIEVQLGKDRRMLVEPGFDAEHLRALVAALEGVA